MTILPFRERPADWRLPFYRRTVLTKGDASRLYEILPGGELGTVQCWIRWNGQPHRAQLCRTKHAVAQVSGQFDREIAALMADGWTIDR